MRIEQLIQHGENINEIDERGIWPLLAAVTYGDKQSVELLLKLGADPNLADQYNYSVLVYCHGFSFKELPCAECINWNLGVFLSYVN